LVAYLALFVALGGSAYAFHLGKNSVGPKQLKKNSVTTAKVKNEAITAAKVKRGTLTGANIADGSLTGTQVNASTLGTVPTAQTANLANSIVPPEAVHLVGRAGEPGFQHKWHGVAGESEVNPVGFYKDREGFVHLQGLALGGKAGENVFQLPPGYRPAAGKLLILSAICLSGCSAPAQTEVLYITGPNSETPEDDGAVSMPLATTIGLDGVTFRAES
jgi:hypothetical protein